MSPPRATVRLQLHRGFGFDAAAATVDYYASLGVSHFYVSPIFAARPGSTHGYDVTDPTCINTELGGVAGLQRLVERLRASDMGLVIDIVPNHMGVAPGINRYWHDLLQWGDQSAYLDWFDIDWQSAAPHLRGKVLLPVLGDAYETVLAAGDLQLHFDPKAGRIEVACYDQRLPLAPSSYAAVLVSQPSLAAVAELFARTTPDGLAAAEQTLAQMAASPDSARALAAALAAFDPATFAGRMQLDALLDKQHYRLSWWRNAAEEINWRRFFEVSDLAGVRVELEPVFEATHAAVFDLYARGWIDGVRADHVDGLSDPEAYCRRLRRRLGELQAARPALLNQQPAWIVVEKILTPNEALPSTWQTDGTTGYDFMDEVGALLHHADGEQALRRLWAELTGDVADFDSHVRQARRQLLAENFVGELDALTLALHRYATASPPQGRDLTLSAIRRVLTGLLTAFRRYRCYVVDSQASAEDRQILHEAVDRAKAILSLPDHALLDRVAGWLGLGAPDDNPASALLRARAVTRFQQLTPPLAAKSVEDTAFYRHAPLLSRNDVGSYPAELAAGLQDFHRANLRRAAHFPHALLATATHDHKRGEDVRARLAVLSECPALWEEKLRGWMAAHRSARTAQRTAGRPSFDAPIPADEIMLYQTLVGAWPPDLQPGDEAGVSALFERVAAWQQKALREAKLHSSWMAPNLPYEQACLDFLHALVQGNLRSGFLPELADIVHRLGPAAEANSLTQTLMRLSCPGVPDLYQGCEFADWSLVDPDNRRPVDMQARRAGLNDPAAGSDKQNLVRRALALRKLHPNLFATGSYLPLEVSGRQREHVVAFARCQPGLQVISVGMRLSFSLVAAESIYGEVDWQDTHIVLPDGWAGAWHNTLSDERIDRGPAGLSVAAIFATGSVALLIAAHPPY